MYAARTTLGVDRTIRDIAAFLARRGVISFMYAQEPQVQWIEYIDSGLRLRLVVTVPSVKDREVRMTPKGYARTEALAQSRARQTLATRWRALLLVVRARYAAIDAGITTVEREFLHAIVLHDNLTVGEKLEPLVAELVGDRTLRLQLGVG